MSSDWGEDISYPFTEIRLFLPICPGGGLALFIFLCPAKPLKSYSEEPQSLWSSPIRLLALIQMAKGLFPSSLMLGAVETPQSQERKNFLFVPLVVKVTSGCTCLRSEINPVVLNVLCNEGFKSLNIESSWG